jgi:glutamyl-tRNA synthetase
MLIAVRTRFAPSPTGDLHLGGVWTALASWAFARAAVGAFVLRVEDLDGPRIVSGTESSIMHDLAWLGLDWDEGADVGGPRGPYRQSLRRHLYDEAIAELAEQGRTYPCDCSRSELARVASAPHSGEELVYPGTCRHKDPSRSFKRAPALRFRVRAHDIVRCHDVMCGPVKSTVVRDAGDFVLKRGDGVFAYQLAVAVDDLAMGISDVLRGADLLGSTPRQLLIMHALSARGGLAWAPKEGVLPRYHHLPLVTDPSGARLAKRTQGATVRELRERGVTAETVVGRVAHALGILDAAAPISPKVLADRVQGVKLSLTKEPWSVPETW